MTGMETYSDGYEAGISYVLETLGVSKETFSELLKLKQTGSAVVVYAKVHESIEGEDFTDHEFLEFGTDQVAQALDLTNRIEDKTND